MRAKMKEREGASGQRREQTKRGAAETKRRSCRGRTPRCDRINYWFLPRPRPRRIFLFVCRRAHLYLLLRSSFRLSQRTHESRLTQKGYIPNEVLGATPLSLTRRAFLILPPPFFALRSFPFSFLLRSKVMPLLFFFFLSALQIRLTRAWQLVSVTIPYFTYFQ